MEDKAFSLAKDLDRLAQRFKKDLPLACCVYNNLLIHAYKYSDKYCFYVLQDNPEAHVLLWKEKAGQMCVGLHCSEDEVNLLKQALRETKLLDWQKSICIFHLPDYLVTPVQEIVNEATGAEMEKGGSDVFKYTKDEKSLRCPAGMKVCRLGEAGIHRMYETWRYKSSATIEEYSQLTSFAANAGVYEDSLNKEGYDVLLSDIERAEDHEIPKAWISITHYGPMGLLMADEQYKMQGLEQLVAQVCGRMMAAQEFFPHICIEDSRAHEKIMFEKLPGWSFSHRLTWVWQSVDEEGRHINEPCP